MDAKEFNAEAQRMTDAQGSMSKEIPTTKLRGKIKAVDS
jgi:hypothetical protein